jgi:rhamnogalacturonan endolyase
MMMATVAFAVERLDRGLVAVESEGGVFLSWRLFADDSHDVRFLILRRQGDGEWQRLTPRPIARTNFLDTTVRRGATYRYQVQAIVGNHERDRSKEVAITVTGNPKPYFALPRLRC